MDNYLKIILNLESELSGMNDVSQNVNEQIEYAIGHCKLALARLRKLVVERGFPDTESEIRFFKQLKPVAYGKLLFYSAVFELESSRLKTNRESHREYLQKQLEKVISYMDDHHVKVQYYRCGFKHLDEQYFLRKNEEIPLELKDSRQLLDEEFFTWHDHTFSMIMANEMLVEYIAREIEKIDDPEGNKQILSKSPLRWTDNKIDLHEIIYALYYAGSVNHGKATITDLADAFEKMFNIEIKRDIYHSPKEMIQRTASAKFLSQLVDIIQRKMTDRLN
ncbi:MAG: RteC domain-containing protein [Mangrovibacterium sp.]